MKPLYKIMVRLASEELAQDMVEYALLSGFIAVAAGATIPPIANDISTVFSKMASLADAVP